MQPKIPSLKVIAPVLAILTLIFWASRFVFGYETTIAVGIYHIVLVAGYWSTSFAYAFLSLERKTRADLIIAIAWFLAGAWWLQDF